MVEDENEDAICNLDQVQDAFIFCPIIKSIEMDSIMAQGIFQSENEMSEGDERKHSFRHKLTEITFDKECYTRDKFQTVEHVLNNMKINTNEEEFVASLNVSGIFKFEKEAPINNWLDTNLESIHGATINLPVDWVQVVELNKNVNWPLFTSIAIDRIEKERLSIPIEAFQFWEQKEFKKMLNEVMDKSAFYKFCHEEEESQGIAYLLLEMFKIRRTISVLNTNPDQAEEFFKIKWGKSPSGYRIIKKLCKLKNSSIKKIFKELPILECENDHAKAINYLLLALTAYRAATQVIYDRLINVVIVCSIFKPMFRTRKYNELNWSHQAIFNLLRSATNIFLIKTLEEFHGLKANMLDNEEYIVANIKANEKDPVKQNLKIIKWFMINELPAKPMHPSNFLPDWERVERRDSTLAKVQTIPSDKRNQKEPKSDKQKMVGHRMRFLIGEENGIINACITTSKEELDYQFQYPGKNKVVKEYANIRDFYSWGDEENTVDTMTRKSDVSPTIYDLRTPMKRKSEKTDNKEIVLLSDESTDIQSNKKGSAKRRTFTSLPATSLLEVSLDDDQTRVKSSGIGELHCYNNDSNQFWTSYISLLTRSINDTPIYFQHQRTNQLTTEWPNYSKQKNKKWPI